VSPAIDSPTFSDQYRAMTATEGAPTPVPQKHRRILAIVVVTVSIIGAAIAFYFYKRHADVWLRSPPRMPACVLVSRRLLAQDENVSGSIPHMAPDGTMVYLRRAEDLAVSCMGRVSSPTASVLAAAFAEVDPDKRARALAAVVRDHVSTRASDDTEALAAYLITTAAIRALPKNQEIDDLRTELEQRNACRFVMRTPCPSRPPIPMPVWIFGAPSSVGIVVSIGWGAKTIATRVRSWWQKRRLAKKSLKIKKQKSSKS
jgi:hypothetical protein